MLYPLSSRKSASNTSYRQEDKEAKIFLVQERGRIVSTVVHMVYIITIIHMETHPCSNTHTLTDKDT